MESSSSHRCEYFQYHLESTEEYIKFALFFTKPQKKNILTILFQNLTTGVWKYLLAFFHSDMDF